MILLLLTALLLASPAWAATYYVSLTGNNGNNCIADSPGTPMQTIAKGVSCLHAGDTLYLRGGTYTEDMSSSAISYPSGTSAGVRVTVAGYPGETVWITRKFQLQDNVDGSNPHYLTFDNMGWPALRVGGTVHHVRISHNNIDGGGLIGSENLVQLVQTTDTIEILSNRIHGAEPGAYGMYCNAQNMLIDGNIIYDNGGYAIHHFLSGGSPTTVNNGVIRNNIIYNNGWQDGGGRDLTLGAVILATGTNIQFYNNVVYNNPTNHGGAAVSAYNSNLVGIWNNTITGNAGLGIEINDSASNTTILNNILYNNAGGGFADYGAVGTTQRHNPTTNPNFTNAGAGDFTLQASSDAIDDGETVATVPTDLLGIARPQGAAYDRGAYEFANGGGPPTPGPQALRWKFDEGANNTVADATGNGYTGALIASPTWGPGRQGSGAVTMDGVSQYVTTGSLVWTAGQPVTVLLWIKATACTASGAFGAHSAVVQDRFGAHLPYSDCVAYFDYGDWHTTGRISVDFTPYLGRWTRVALVSSGNGGTFKGIYANGVLAASGTSSGAPTTNLTTLDVGRWQQESGTLYEAASLDNFSVENRVWSAAEILSDYRQQAMARRHRVSLR